MTPTNGCLILLSGGRETIILNDAAFALIQKRRTEMIAGGYRKENLIIKYKK